VLCKRRLDGVADQSRTLASVNLLPVCLESCEMSTDETEDELTFVDAYEVEDIAAAL
jgi:hypothetical protein